MTAIPAHVLVFLSTNPSLTSDDLPFRYDQRQMLMRCSPLRRMQGTCSGRDGEGEPNAHPVPAPDLDNRAAVLGELRVLRCAVVSRVACGMSLLPR